MDWKTLYRELRTLNWLILLILSSGSFALWGQAQATGVLVGGLIIIANFSLLQHTICRVFLPKGEMKREKVSIIAKYYFRLLGLGIILYFLVGHGRIHPVGLAVGLSTIYLSVVIVGIQKAIRMKSEGAI
jgi:hypothetical protein